MPGCEAVVVIPSENRLYLKQGSLARLQRTSSGLIYRSGSHVVARITAEGDRRVARLYPSAAMLTGYDFKDIGDYSCRESVGGPDSPYCKVYGDPYEVIEECHQDARCAAVVGVGGTFYRKQGVSLAEAIRADSRDTYVKVS